MSFGSSNRTALRFVKETVFGETPATPTLQDLRYTGEGLNYNLSNITSDEIRADRATANLIQVQSDASGDINVELSFDSYDGFLEGAMASTWSADLAISATDISTTVTTNIISSSSTDFVAAGIVVGQWIEVGGFTDPANNGYFRVKAVTANQIDVYSNLVTEASGATITIGGSMIRNGTDLTSYTIQKHIQDSTTPTFFNFTGCRVGGLSLTFATGAILGGAFSFMGLGSNTDTAQIAGATTNVATTTEPMNAVGNLLDIRMDNVTSTAKFSNLTMNLSNNLRAQDAIGSLPHIGVALGRLEVTGDISVYFEDTSTYNLFLNSTAFTLSFRAEDNAGNAYIFTFPSVKFETGAVVSGGLDQDVMLEGTWRAILDGDTQCMAQIDKFSA